MWCITKDGFLSVVGLRNPITPKEHDILMVRARQFDHLDGLIDYAHVHHELQLDVRDDIGHDYKYRVFVSRKVFAGYIQEMAEHIDYPNFKDAASTSIHWGLRGQQALGKIWEILWDLLGRRDGPKNSYSDLSTYTRRTIGDLYARDPEVFVDMPDEWDPEKEFL